VRLTPKIMDINRTGVAIALDKKRITPDTWFKTGYKKFDITGGQSVSDDDYFDRIPGNLQNFLIYSTFIVLLLFMNFFIRNCAF